MIKVVSFDFDDTLVSLEIDKEFWFFEIPKLYAKQNNVSFDEARKHCEAEYDKVTSNHIDWYFPSKWFKRFGLKQDHKQVIRDLKHLVRVLPHAESVLKKLREKGFKVILFSNAHRDFMDLKLEATGLGKYFDEVYSLPSDHNSFKTPEEFEKLVKRLGVKPNEVIHVGDVFNDDFICPKKAGLKAIYLKNKGELSREEKESGEVAKNLKEALELILKRNVD